jgi:hypothetical protein
LLHYLLSDYKECPKTDHFALSVAKTRCSVLLQWHFCCLSSALFPAFQFQSWPSAWDWSPQSHPSPSLRLGLQCPVPAIGRQTGGQFQFLPALCVAWPDGLSTGCLASHTLDGTIRCSHSRPIDERTRWATSAKHIPMFKAPLATTRGGLAATVTSTSGPPDGLSTGCLASHTLGGTIRCSHSRPIDEWTRLHASVKL